jgi:hypothetical protein
MRPLCLHTPHCVLQVSQQELGQGLKSDQLDWSQMWQLLQKVAAQQQQQQQGAAPAAAGAAADDAAAQLDRHLREAEGVAMTPPPYPGTHNCCQYPCSVPCAVLSFVLLSSPQPYPPRHLPTPTSSQLNLPIPTHTPHPAPTLFICAGARRLLRWEQRLMLLPSERDNTVALISPPPPFVLCLHACSSPSVVALKAASNAACDGCLLIHPHYPHVAVCGSLSAPVCRSPCLQEPVACCAGSSV